MPISPCCVWGALPALLTPSPIGLWVQSCCPAVLIASLLLLLLSVMHLTVIPPVWAALGSFGLSLKFLEAKIEVRDSAFISPESE